MSESTATVRGGDINSSERNAEEEVSRIVEQSKELQESATSLITQHSQEEASLRQRALAVDSNIKSLHSFIASSVKKGDLDPKDAEKLQAKVFHYGSISLIVEPCISTDLKAMEVAKDAGALLSYDPNLRLPLWPSAEEAHEQIVSIWEKAEVIKVSDNELEFLTGCDKIDDETTMSLWHPNLKLLLVTLGDKDCNYYTKAPGYHPIIFRF